MAINNCLCSRECVDFNMVKNSAVAPVFRDAYVCPYDRIPQMTCKRDLPFMNKSTVIPTTLDMSDILVMLLIGPKGARLNAIDWWLQFLPQEGFRNGKMMNLVLIADACANGSNCSDSAAVTADHIAKKHGALIKVHIARGQPGADEGYDRLACKLLTCAVQIDAHFAAHRYYLKIDDDTVLFPRRLVRLLNTLHSAVADESVPLYVGTVSHLQKPKPLCGELGWVANSSEPSGGRVTYMSKDGTTEGQSICYAQGGAGYVLNRAAFLGLVSRPTLCTREMDLESASEDTYVGFKLFRDLGARLIHCGGFRPSGLAADAHMSSAVTFHRVSEHWLQSRNLTDMRSRCPDIFEPSSE